MYASVPSSCPAPRLPRQRALVIEGARNAEVDDLDAPFGGNEHVGGLEVAVHDSSEVRVVHGLGELDQERKSRGLVECAFRRVMRQRCPVDELEDEVALALGRATELDHLRDRRMLKAP